MKALLLLLAFALALTGTARSQMSIELLDSTTSWRYFDKATVPPTVAGKTWTDPAYNDSEAAAPSWDNGRAPFGYGDSFNYGANDYSSTPGASAALHFGPDANNKFITTYFRTKFFIADTVDIGTSPDQFNILALRTRVDDGFVVYINGVEVRRYNMPSGPIANNTPALAAIEALWVTYSVPIDFTDLVLNTGSTPNVIAVEIHQASATSSDIAFEQELFLQNVPACEGLARPGIREHFDNATDFGHFRQALDQTIPIETQDTDLGWQLTSVVPISAFHPSINTSIRGPQAGFPLPLGNAFQFSGGTAIWESEVIDIRDHKDIQFKAKVQHISNTGATYSSADKLSLYVLGSQDGVFFQPKTWWSTDGDIQWTEIFAEAQPKKALVPPAANNPDNSTGASNWRTLNFNDAAWKSGTGGVGYENDSANTYTPLIGAGLDVKTEMLSKATACYVRVKFSIANPAQFTRARLRMKFDDGFVAYLNGIKIAEYNYQPATGTPRTYPPAFNINASADWPDANALAWKDFEITDSATLSSVLGSLSSAPNGNILAIYGLNASTTSSDFLCIPALDLGVGDPPAMSSQDLDDKNQSTYVQIASPVDSPKIVPPGTNFVKVQVVTSLTNTKQLALDDVEVLGTPTAVMSYYSFMKTKFPTRPDAELSATADMDGDSLLNIAEYGTGTDPGAPLLNAPNPNNLPQQFAPQVFFDPDNRIRIRFRVPASVDLTAPDPANQVFGYTAGDLNIRPQLSRGVIGSNGAVEWEDGVVGANEFVTVGQPEEVDDGTHSQWVTMRTSTPVSFGEKQMFVRIRYGVVLPHHLKSGEPCFNEF